VLDGLKHRPLAPDPVELFARAFIAAVNARGTTLI